ncbi:uncharacterized protein MONOS_6715 [Monocercomonoides exilis]|uniref:uncharacterized protein n=1 Tax=Monocercomonoides exilis TaxID=2049356 RepID=UPI00355A7D49|nr:hypothetical protein MONOS_6715 [Monocercomonoides exilis]|eukprot:MONOS_6715.1-p1 / transcript=MONOS_6715.1 / gene=MONOS_6715 / organism=Monocercomonoides_exilis_PA203 / gene_product=unspecified product / transcript_product=unspecified product / location=Mono_scaffold00216:59228-62789(-) / protein_length=1037 / sequence_SO=supercontig / SO=protein_coding / is_pseudo=false
MLSIIVVALFELISCIEDFHQPNYDERGAYEFYGRKRFNNPRDIEEWKKAPKEINNLVEKTLETYENSSNYRWSELQDNSLARKLSSMIAPVMVLFCLCGGWFTVWIIVQCAKCCCCSQKENHGRKHCWGEKGPSKCVSIPLRLLYIGLTIGLMIGVGTIAHGFLQIPKQGEPLFMDISNYLSGFKHTFKFASKGEEAATGMTDSLIKSLGFYGEDLRSQIQHLSTCVDSLNQTFETRNNFFKTLVKEDFSKMYPASVQESFQLLHSMKIKLNYSYCRNNSTHKKEFIVHSSKLADGSDSLNETMKDAIKTVIKAFEESSPFNKTSTFLPTNMLLLHSGLNYTYRLASLDAAKATDLLKTYQTKVVELPASIENSFNNSQQSFFSSVDDNFDHKNLTYELYYEFSYLDAIRSFFFNVTDALNGILVCTGVHPTITETDPEIVKQYCQKAKMFISNETWPVYETEEEVSLDSLIGERTEKTYFEALTNGTTELADKAIEIKTSLNETLKAFESTNCVGSLMESVEEISNVTEELEQTFAIAIDGLSAVSGTFNKYVTKPINTLSQELESSNAERDAGKIKSQCRRIQAAFNAIAAVIIVLLSVKSLLTILSCSSNCVGVSICLEFSFVSFFGVFLVMCCALSIVLSEVSTYAYNGGISDLLGREIVARTIDKETDGLKKLKDSLKKEWLKNGTFYDDKDEEFYFESNMFSNSNNDTVSTAVRIFIKTIIEFWNASPNSVETDLLKVIHSALDPLSETYKELSYDVPRNPLFNLPSGIAVKPSLIMKSKISEATRRSEEAMKNFTDGVDRTLNPYHFGQFIHEIADPILIHMVRGTVSIWQGTLLVIAFAIPHLILAMIGRKEWAMYRSYKNKDGETVYAEVGCFGCCRSKKSKPTASYYDPENDTTNQSAPAQRIESVHAVPLPTNQTVNYVHMDDKAMEQPPVVAYRTIPGMQMLYPQSNGAYIQMQVLPQPFMQTPQSQPLQQLPAEQPLHPYPQLPEQITIQPVVYAAQPQLQQPANTGGNNISAPVIPPPLQL